MSNWLTPSQSSGLQSSGPQSSGLQSSDTVELPTVSIDPGLPSPAPTGVDDDLSDLAPPSEQSYTPSDLVEQTYPDPAYAEPASSDRHPRQASDGLSIVGIVLAAGASALAVAILLALFLRHDGLVNRQRLFPEADAAATTVSTATVEPFDTPSNHIFLDGEPS